MISATAKRVLVFNVNWLGDVLFSTAVIRNIRKNFPDSFIACVIPSRCLAVLEGNPHVNEIILFDEKGKHKSVLEKMRFVKQLRDRHFDIVYLLHRSLTRALISRLARIPERIGYYTKKRGFLLTQKILPPCVDAVHRIDYYLNIIAKSGLVIHDRHSEFYVSAAHTKKVEHFLQEEGVSSGDFCVGINPGGNWDPKRWPVESWAATADQLIRQLHAKVIITGDKKDISLAGRIQSLMKEKPIIAAGVLNIKEFAALCQRFDVFISADTGPLHIANAVGTKNIIALFGPTHPDITGPVPAERVTIIQKKADCLIPCYVVDCADNRCMKLITSDDVVHEVAKIKRA